MLITSTQHLKIKTTVTASLWTALATMSLLGQNVKPGKADATQQLGIVPHELRVALNRGEDALGEHRFADAFEHFAPILKKETADYFLSPSGPSLKTVLLQRLSALDAEAAATWQQICSSQASIELEGAVSRRDVFICSGFRFSALHGHVLCE